MRMRVVAIAHCLRPLRVGATHELADPVARIACTLGDCGGGLPLGEEPEHLSPTTLVWFLGCPVAPLELIHLQVGFQAHASSHGPILQRPGTNRYHANTDALLSPRTQVRGRPLDVITHPNATG